MLKDRTLDDAGLVAAVRRGDRAAVAELYERHAATVRFVIRDRVRTPDLVEELVQETFTRSLERLDGLRRPERYRSWLLTIARNVATDRQRLEQRQVGVEPEVLEEELGSAASAEAVNGRHDLANRVGAALAQLNRRDALALTLVTHLGMTPTEIAVVLGITPNAAKVVVHRARRRLRDLLVTEALDEAEAPCPEFRDEADRAARRRHVAGCRECLRAGQALLRDLGEDAAA